MDENNQSNQYGQDSNSQYGGNPYNQNPNTQYTSYPYGQDSNAQGNNQYGQNPNAQNSSQYGQNANTQYSQYGQGTNNHYSQYGQNANNQYNNQYGSNANNYQDYTAYNPGQMTYSESGSNPANGLQIASLICGILGICLSCCIAVPGLILGTAGIICAIMGNRRGKHGMGTAGLICSIIALICGVIMGIYWAASFSEALRLIEEMGYYYY